MSRRDASGFAREIFVLPPPEHCLCVICSEVLNEPRRCEFNHNYCGKCIDKWMKVRKSCPACRCELSIQMIQNNEEISNTIDNLECYCPTTDKIENRALILCCDWTGPKRNRETHLKDCGFIKTKCTNLKCNKAMLRHKLADHVLNTCNNRTVICNLCEQTILFSDLQQHQNNCIFTQPTIQDNNISSSTLSAIAAKVDFLMNEITSLRTENRVLQVKMYTMEDNYMELKEKYEKLERKIDSYQNNNDSNNSGVPPHSSFVSLSPFISASHDLSLNSHQLPVSKKRFLTGELKENSGCVDDASSSCDNSTSNDDDNTSSTNVCASASASVCVSTNSDNESSSSNTILDSSSCSEISKETDKTTNTVITGMESSGSNNTNTSDTTKPDWVSDYNSADTNDSVSDGGILEYSMDTCNKPSMADRTDTNNSNNNNVNNINNTTIHHRYSHLIDLTQDTNNSVPQVAILDTTTNGNIQFYSRNTRHKSYEQTLNTEFSAYKTITPDLYYELIELVSSVGAEDADIIANKFQIKYNGIPHSNIVKRINQLMQKSRFLTDHSGSYNSISRSHNIGNNNNSNSGNSNYNNNSAKNGWQIRTEIENKSIEEIERYIYKNEHPPPPRACMITHRKPPTHQSARDLLTSGRPHTTNTTSISPHHGEPLNTTSEQNVCRSYNTLSPDLYMELIELANKSGTRGAASIATEFQLKYCSISHGEISRKLGQLAVKTKVLGGVKGRVEYGWQVRDDLENKTAEEIEHILKKKSQHTVSGVMKTKRVSTAGTAPPPQLAERLSQSKDTYMSISGNSNSENSNSSGSSNSSSWSNNSNTHIVINRNSGSSDNGDNEVHAAYLTHSTNKHHIVTSPNKATPDSSNTANKSNVANITDSTHSFNGAISAFHDARISDIESESEAADIQVDMSDISVTATATVAATAAATTTATAETDDDIDAPVDIATAVIIATDTSVIETAIAAITAGGTATTTIAAPTAAVSTTESTNNIPESLYPELCRVIVASGSVSMTLLVKKIRSKYSAYSNEDIANLISQLAVKERFHWQDKKSVWLLKYENLKYFTTSFVKKYEAPTRGCRGVMTTTKYPRPFSRNVAPRAPNSAFGYFYGEFKATAKQFIGNEVQNKFALEDRVRDMLNKMWNELPAERSERYTNLQKRDVKRYNDEILRWEELQDRSEHSSENSENSDFED